MPIIHIFPPLETERLILRALTQNDLDFLFRHFSDPQIYRYLLDEDPVTTEAEAQEILDFYLPQHNLPQLDKPYNRWLITRKQDRQPIGTCGFHKWQQRHHLAEIGYDLEVASWRQGYMREALRAVLQHGFEAMGLNRIEAQVYPENIASLRLLERLGFQKEGLRRQSLYQAGKYYDHWLLSLLKADWGSA